MSHYFFVKAWLGNEIGRKDKNISGSFDKKSKSVFLQKKNIRREVTKLLGNEHGITAHYILLPNCRLTGERCEEFTL